MINSKLRDYDLALSTIEMFAHRNPFVKSSYLEREEAKVIREHFKPLIKTFQDLEMQEAADQVQAILMSIGGLMPNPSKTEFETRCQILVQTIHRAAKKVRFYYYPNDKADFLEKVDANWERIFSAFHGTKSEVKAGIDLWAMGHPTASVFHMMRATEIGLRWLAKKMEVKFPTKPTEWAQWGQLLEKMDQKIIALRKTTAGPKRDIDLKFYREAVTDMRALAERRDAVMHVRGYFDEHEARSTIDRVHHLLTGLARKVPKKKGA